MVSSAPHSIGPYTITREIGRGGMGVVYLARDTRLDRDVAIKALPEHLAGDPDRLSRFEREARTLASLNHPNVAGIYGVEEQGGHKYLVLEYVEGQTLAERLDRGPLPVDEVIELAIQIASGVEAAHEAGVIHRDLKPGNIIITPEGKVKVLDFGLAKVAEGASSGTFKAGVREGIRAPADGVREGVRSPAEGEVVHGSAGETLTSPAYRQHSPTMPGVILGTAAYMSPEQARGRSIDKRTDIWSFGVVLYECLTGINPFVGETVTDSIGAILHRDVDMTLLPAGTPPVVRLLFRRCLVKDRQRRQRDIGDARVDLEFAAGDFSVGGLLAEGDAVAGTSGRQRVLNVVLALFLIAAAGLTGYWAARSIGSGIMQGELPVVRFSIGFPESEGVALVVGETASIALDRAGTLMAYTVYKDNARHIILRPLNSREGRVLPGTGGAQQLFFSPDGQWIGFESGGRVMRIPVSGGMALTIVEANAQNLTWLDDGTVAYTVNQGDAIERIDSRGGSATLLAKSDREERVPGRAQFVAGFDNLHTVPDAEYMLAAVWDGVTIEDYDVVSVSLTDGTVRQVVANANHPQFVAPDLLLFHREGSLFAVGFDRHRGTITGNAELVLKDVRTGHWGDEAHYAVSLTGTLAYVPGGRMGPGRMLVRVDATGQSVPLTDKTDAIIGGLRVSPDESQVALLTLRRKIDLWAFDLNRRTLALVDDAGELYAPAWFPNGHELVYQRLASDTHKAVIRRRVDAPEQVHVVVEGDAGDLQPTSVSPDGKFLVLRRENSPGHQRDDIVLMDLEAGDAPRPLVATGANEGGAVISPDGKWLAYESNETGRQQVYVRPFPDGGRRWQVSTEGGFAPRWARDGTKLFFIHDDALHASKVNSGDGFSSGAPEKLFDVNRIASLDVWGTFDVLSDGAFIMVEPAAWEKVPPRIDVVVNWASELRRP